MAKGKVTVDVRQESKPPPPMGPGQYVSAMALRFSGGIEGITAPLAVDQKIYVLLECEVAGVNHHRKMSDKTRIIERAHALSVVDGWVIEPDTGSELAQGLRIARVDVQGGTADMGDLLNDPNEEAEGSDEA